MKLLFLLVTILSVSSYGETRRFSDDERLNSIMENRRRMLAEEARCVPHPNAVRRNLDNFIRQINADTNLRLPKYCMDVNQRRQYREIFRNDPAFRAAADRGYERFKRRHPLPDYGRVDCSKRSPMKVRTPTSLLGGARG